MKPRTRIHNKKVKLVASSNERLSKVLHEIYKIDKKTQYAVIHKVRIFNKWMKIDESEVEYYLSLSFAVKKFPI